jgi:hypothetical protein
MTFKGSKSWIIIKALRYNKPANGLALFLNPRAY